MWRVSNFSVSLVSKHLMVMSLISHLLSLRLENVLSNISMYVLKLSILTNKTLAVVWTFMSGRHCVGGVG